MADDSPTVSKALLRNVSPDQPDSNESLERELVSLRTGIEGASGSASDSPRSSKLCAGPCAEVKALQERLLTLQAAHAVVLEEASVQRRHLAVLEEEVEAARAEASMGQAGITALAEELQKAQAACGVLNAEVQAARSAREAAQALLCAREAAELVLRRDLDAARLDTLHLRQQVASMQQEGARLHAQQQQAVGEGQAAAGGTCRARTASIQQAPVPASSAAGQQLPDTVAEASVEHATHNPREQVRAPEERLAAVGGGVARQLSPEQQEAQQEVTQGRELRQERALAPQQEASPFRQAPADLTASAPQQLLKHSPRRSLGQRVRELMGPRMKGTSCSGSPTGAGCSAAADSPRAPFPGHAHEPGPSTAGLTQQLQQARQQVAALEGRLLAVEAEALGRGAEAEAARAELRGQEAKLAFVRGRLLEVQAAADALLQQHSPAPAGLASNPSLCSTADSRAAIQALHAQVWRERLARQRAQAEVLEWRLGLSAPDAAGAGAGDEGVDEAAMASLEAEVRRTDHLAIELRRCRAAQARLEKRADRLELRLTECNRLLAAAEPLLQMPLLAGNPHGSLVRASSSCAASPASRSRATRLPSAPTRTARIALQASEAAEGAAKLLEQLEAAQSEVASLRRREQETAAAHKAAQVRRQELEGRHVALASGLRTLHHLLERKAADCTGSQLGGTRQHGSRPRPSTNSQASVGGAMAALSALLKEFGVPGEESVSGGASVVSPQGSEAGDGATGAEGPALAEAGPEGGLPRSGGEAETASDPLDPGLLPLEDCGDAAVHARQPSPAQAVPHRGGRSATPTAATCNRNSRSAEFGSAESAAVPAKLGPCKAPAPALPAQPSKLAGSRAPAPPLAKPSCSPTHRGGGFRQLMLGPCSRLSPRATVSVGGEPGSSRPITSSARQR